MTTDPFEEHILAVLQAQSFLLTVLVRERLAGMTPEEADSTITSLLRHFSSLDLPADTQTDEATLRAISDRHVQAQGILRQMLDFARPRAGAGSPDTDQA